MKTLSDKEGNLTEYGVARMLANPLYCLGEHAIISEEEFIKAGVQSINEKGAEEYIRHILENLKGNYV